MGIYQIQFYVALVHRVCCRLDGKHVVFGKVISGEDIVKKIEGYGTQSGKPTAQITIDNCGQL